MTKIAPHLRDFAERLLAGESQLSAWCAARGCEPSPSASAAASRAKNGKAFQAYMAELQARAKVKGVGPVGGAAAIEVLEEKRRTLEAAIMDREQCMRWLCEVIVTSPWDLICRDPASEHFGRPDPAKGHLCQRMRISGEGEVMLEMPSKNEAMKMLVALMPERDVTNPTLESGIRKLAAMLPDTAGPELGPKPAAVLAPVPEPAAIPLPSPVALVPGWSPPEEAVLFGAAFGHPAEGWTEAERKAYEEPLKNWLEMTAGEIELLTGWLERNPERKPADFADLLRNRQALCKQADDERSRTQPVRRQYRDPGAILIGHR